jgi:transcription factor SPN1
VAATKKLKMLPSVISQLQKADLQMTLLESGVLPVFTEWLAPLPDKSLPHLQIREGLLKALQDFPPIDRDVLKSSCIGKAVMLLFRHPKETRQNRDRASKLINEWARPIFGLVANVKAISREEREQQDYSNLSKFRRRMSSSDSVQRRKSIEGALKDEQASASKPGDPGWCPRARVPQPSNRDYVVRPKWNIEQELMKTRKSGPDRYEKHARRFADKKSRNSVQRMRATTLSITGNKMGL